MRPYRVLAYGDCNTWGWVPVEQGFPSTCYDDPLRWTGVAARLLSLDYLIEVDGLSARAIDQDDPIDWGTIAGRDLNGRTHLPAAIARAMPLDLVVLLLGTNDTRADYARSASDITQSAVSLARLCETCTGVATPYRPPTALVVAPVPLSAINHPDQGRFFEGAGPKSRALGAAMRDAAAAAGLALADAAEAVPETHGTDGIYLSEDDHLRLGAHLAAAIGRVLPRAPGEGRGAPA